MQKFLISIWIVNSFARMFSRRECAFRVARMVCGDGLPSRTDFWVLGKSEVDFTSEVAPSELVPDISSLETRWGLPEITQRVLLHLR